jgi:hypothetical protein
MQLIDRKFRCDLCGRFAVRGVTEARALDGQTTEICDHCVRRANGLVLEARPEVDEDADTDKLPEGA